MIALLAAALLLAAAPAPEKDAAAKGAAPQKPAAAKAAPAEKPAAVKGAAPAKEAPRGVVVDRVAGTVDGEVITLSEVEDRAGGELRRADVFSGKEREEARAKALQRAFDQLVAEKLLQKQAKALALEVTEQQIDAAIEDVKTRNHFDDEALDRALEGQGLDRTTFRAQIRRELETYQVMQAKVRGRAKLTEEDLRNYYQSHPQEFEGDPEIHVRHIFLPVADGATPAEEASVRAQGDKILARLKGGEDFAKVARELSKGPSAKEGGDLGWLKRGTIQKQLEDVAFSLEDGRSSGLVRAGPGFHILKVEGRRIGGSRSFDEVRDEIRGRLLEEQLGQTRQQVLDELRKGAVVEVKVPELRG